MKINKKIIIAIVLAAIAAAGLIAGVLIVSGGVLDVVQADSARAFGEVLQELPAADGWVITAPDGSSRFFWANNTASISVDAAPFIAAGLHTDQLNAGALVYNGRELYCGFVSTSVTTTPPTTPFKDYAALASNARNTINFHTSLDHYGVKLGDGNMFEWAKNMETNEYDNTPQDKDIVFVLNPEPLIAAGVNPNKVEGWAYAQVQVEENGKPALVWKFLKPFDLQ